MATIKTTASASLTLSQTEGYAIQLKALRDSHPAKLLAIEQSKEAAKQTVLAMGLSESDYNKIHSLFIRT